ncbi:ABC transporter ATP-binding protein [Thiohalobacter thiocyanaticus]|uniref:ABC-type dipeptide transporter n=1 Tax=Thiohalobacter thiocyanaticus TaxID=585455 RepID=A0A426QGG2_9GAMM|nr:ABC transporter ATP-binding protein [Thiohalobacter thiocyanaticus]RRQ20820.1 ABC transporter ATP-binding protein [Thiohalobacter thiocyanaticus]
MTDKLLTVRDLQVRFGEGEGAVRAVDGVSFAIDRGETLALLGESGCGKSMTALALLRLLPQPVGHIAGGQVLLEGQDLLALPEMRMRQVRGGRIAMIFQEPMTSLNPVMTVGRQIGEVLAAHKGLKGRAARARSVELLGLVGIPDAGRRVDEYPHQLSGGMKQRVMIAMALAGEPDLLIADEPTTALDVTIQAQVLELMRDIQRETGMAMLLITHDLGVVAGMADRVAVMYAGQLVEQASRADFFTEPRHPYSRKLFAALPDMDKRDRPLTVIPGTVPTLDQSFHACRFADRCASAWRTCHEVEPAWLEEADGRGVRCHLYDPAHPNPPAAGSEAEPDRLAARSAAPRDLLEVSRLKVHFPIHKGLFKRTVGHVYAVDDVDIHIPTGRTLALVGESGCGKTTVGKAILQLLRPTAGSVRFDGDELTRLRGEALRRRRREFQIIFQDPFSSMNPRMQVGDIIEEGMVAQGLVPDAGARRQRVEELLEQVGLRPEHARRYPHEFSGGQRQRICVARALAVEPRLIICDEPTSALDVSVQAQILNLLKRLQLELDLAYLFITHNISVVAYLADRVAVMYLGRIVEEGPVDRVLTDPQHPYTRALLSAVPRIDTDTGREVIRLEGDIPSPSNPPTGCHFHPRCPQAMERCRQAYPDRFERGSEHWARCWLLE